MKCYFSGPLPGSSRLPDFAQPEVHVGIEEDRQGPSL